MKPRNGLTTKGLHSDSIPAGQASDNLSLLSGRLAGLNICVVGGGFVGLVAAAGFASFGHRVICVEKNPEYLKQLESGKVPFYERDLQELIQTQVKEERLSFSGDLKGAVDNQRVIFITVGTPSDASGRAALKALFEVIDDLAMVAGSEQVIVLKSTVPVGTGKLLRERLASRNGGIVCPAIVNNPEFLREGSAVFDFFNPQRIVIGGDDSAAVQTVSDVYRIGMTRPVPILTTNNETAEMIKYASNAFLTTKVGFINELAGLCDHTGVDVLEVARGMGMDPRIGPEFLEPGPGWGGSCFGKDMREFTGLAASNGFELMIGKAVLASNQRQFTRVVDKVKHSVGDLKGSRIAVLGLAFKANTSDMRESASIPIISQLLEAGATVIAHDPKACIGAAEHFPDLSLAETPYDAAQDADCLLILTEWEEYQALDFRKLAQSMKQKKIVDTRNLLVPDSVTRYGFDYIGMGQA